VELAVSVPLAPTPQMLLEEWAASASLGAAMRHAVREIATTREPKSNVLKRYHSLFWIPFPIIPGCSVRLHSSLPDWQAVLHRVFLFLGYFSTIAGRTD
jgi:hypothetical protein